MNCYNISIDKFDQMIYYLSDEGKTRLLDPVTLKDTLSSVIKGMPAFARSKHFAAYNYRNDTYTYDFFTGITTKIIERDDNMWLLNPKEIFFSPNDTYLFIQAVGEQNIYDFSNNTYTIIPPGTLNSLYYEWLDDTTIIHSNLNINTFEPAEIYSFNVLTQQQDTIFRGEEGDELFNFTTNKIDRILSFTRRYSNNQNFKRIEAKFYETSVDSFLFDLNRDDPSSDCISFPQVPHWQAWNVDETKLAFFLYSYFGQMSGIFIYDITTAQTKSYTSCHFNDLKRDLNWLNDSTLIYYNATLIGIYEFKLNQTGINDAVAKSVDEELNITGYPNPFNSEIVFGLTPEMQITQIRIFNTLGSEVRRIDISNQNQIRWDGKNNEGTELTSGTYFIVFSAPTVRQKTISKVLFLK